MAKQRSRGGTKPRRRDRKGGPGSGRRKPCPYCRDKIEQVDYKDVGALRRLRVRARQDPLAPHHRHLPSSSEPDRQGGQAGSRGGAPSVRRATPRDEREDRGGGEDATAAATATADLLPEAILLQDVEHSASGERSSTSRRATCATTWSRASSPSPPPRAAEAAQRRGGARERARGGRLAGAGERRAAQQDRPGHPRAGGRGRPAVRLGQLAGHRGRDPRRPRHRIDQRKVHLDDPIRPWNPHGRDRVADGSPRPSRRWSSKRSSRRLARCSRASGTRSRSPSPTSRPRRGRSPSCPSIVAPSSLNVPA